MRFSPMNVIAMLKWQVIASPKVPVIARPGGPMQSCWNYLALLTLATLLTCRIATSSPNIVVEDIFGRDVSKGIELLDWEGYLANPAIKLYVKTTSAKTEINLESSHHRLYFSLPSTLSESGSKKKITLTPSEPRQSFYIAIFPDRDGNSEDHLLRVISNEPFGQMKTLTIPIRIRDEDKVEEVIPQPSYFSVNNFPFVDDKPRGQIQDPFPFVTEPLKATHPSPFTITLDFSKDQSGIFDDIEYRKSVRQAADDWAYFIDDMGFDPVSVNSESTEVYPTQSTVGTPLSNVYPFRDFLMYIVNRKSTHELDYTASAATGFQSQGGKSTQLRRSGYVTFITGHLPYTPHIDDDSWWRFVYHTKLRSELYSIALHEMGHALAFLDLYPTAHNWANAKSITDFSVGEYHGSYPTLTGEFHLQKAAHRSEEKKGDTKDPTTPPKSNSSEEEPLYQKLRTDEEKIHHSVSSMEIDRISKRGAYGTTAGLMPQRRWLLTKLDLLTLRAVGYKLKKINALNSPLVLNKVNPVYDLKNGERGIISLRAQGGIPSYYFYVESGELPPGLVLDSFSGEISGIPTERGIYNLAVTVRDSDEEDTLGLTQCFAIEVK